VSTDIADELNRALSSLKAIVFDFDGVFTDNSVWVDQNGIESVRCWRSDGLGLTRLRELGLRILIVSTEQNPVVSIRANKLKTECIQGVDDKAAAIAKWAEDTGIPLSHVAFVGNDINDIPALKMVGLALGVSDAYEEILPLIQYRTVRRGGYGAVREVCDLIANAHVWLNER
jgi:YrbI family 3-deoxy-D-manno-octulosonate 8-phosphate phosphatase